MTTDPIAHALRGNPPPPHLDLDWAAARQEIAGTENYHVCTVGSHAAPHVVPVLGVWVDDALMFNTERSARKFHHLEANPATAIAVPGSAYDFTLEGRADAVTDPAVLARVAAAFPVKYAWWHPTVRDGEFFADETSEPRAVFAVRPRNVFGFGKAKGFSGTRWSFDP